MLTTLVLSWIPAAGSQQASVKPAPLLLKHARTESWKGSAFNLC